MFKSKPCSETLCQNPSFAKGLCKAHQHLRKDKKVKGFSTVFRDNPEKKEELNRQKEFFLKIWNDREHKSEVSGERLFGEPLSIYFHHILSKEHYEEAKFDPDNIILLTWEEHSDVELNLTKYEKINQMRRELLKKYNL